MNTNETPTAATSGEPTPAPGLPEDMLIILPVRNMVMFPGVVLPVAIKREKTVAGAQEAVRTEAKVGFLLQKDAQTEDPGFDELHRVGTVASIIRYITAPDGTHHLVCQGERRFRVLDRVGGFPYLVARVEFLADTGTSHPEVEARTLYLKQKDAGIKKFTKAVLLCYMKIPVIIYYAERLCVDRVPSAVSLLP